MIPLLYRKGEAGVRGEERLLVSPSQGLAVRVRAGRTGGRRGGFVGGSKGGEQVREIRTGRKQ